MSKTQMFGFNLEAHDGSVDPSQQQQRGANQQSGAEATMDTDHVEEMEKHKPQVKFNTNFLKLSQGEDPSQQSPEVFTITRLFEAAASGEAGQLSNLYEYLHLNMKYLSDSSYQSYGKTALMKALLHLRDGKNETVELMIEISERRGDIKKFVNAAWTSSYYKGQTALHVAIERRSLYYVKLLVSKGADVHAKAIGKFFKPHSGPHFYFGELPLSLAACTNQPDIVDFLMLNEDPRADPSIADSHGNTVLHALVAVADNSEANTEFITKMYDRILKLTAQLKPKLKLEDKENDKGLTPLKMAAKTGKSGIFSHMLKREFHESHSKHLSRKFTEWIYGPVNSSLYDLASIDTYGGKSVLEILVYGSDIPNRHEMLQTEPLSRLLEVKWNKFARHMFLFNFLVYLLYLAVFTFVAYTKKKGQPPYAIEHTVEGYLYVSGQLGLTLSNLYFFVIGIVDMRRKRPKLQSLLVDGYYEILFLIQSFLFLSAAVLYLCGWPEYLCFMVLSLALSWVNVLYFSRGHSHMGVYSIMIQKMILCDILRFLFVYITFLFGFSAAVVSLLREKPEVPANATQPSKGRIFETVPSTDCVKPTFRNISYTTLELFKFTIGMGDVEFTENYEYKEVFYVLLIAYIVLTYILLLNMLIALMNRTVEKTATESTSIWKLQRAVAILDMERRLPRCLGRRFRCGVLQKLRTALGDEQRWCFRVEEVNWNEWNRNLSNINEDPGFCDNTQTPGSDSPPRRQRRGRSLRALFMEGSRRRRQSTELSPLSPAQV